LQAAWSLLSGPSSHSSPSSTVPSPQKDGATVVPVVVVSSPEVEVESSPVEVVSSLEEEDEEVLDPVVSSPVEVSPMGSSLRRQAAPRARIRRRGRRDMGSSDRSRGGGRRVWTVLQGGGGS
jgi:hypothetical protein